MAVVFGGNLDSGPTVFKLLEGMEFGEMLTKDQRLDGIGRYLDRGESELFFALLSEAGDTMKAVGSKNSNVAVETYYAIALSLLSHINRWNLTERIDHLIDVNKLMNIDNFETVEEAVAYLNEVSTILFHLQGELRKKQANTAIDSVKDFIEKHPDEDLSLIHLAEQVFLNASYLSRLFKQTVGMNLSEYIEKARILKAKELLKKRDMKVHEVAKQVGYESAASFTRLFRKATGYSPQEYRRLGSGE